MLPSLSEEAVRQAEAEGLTLLEADNTAGFKGVAFNSSRKAKPYKTRVPRGGKSVSLGHFATAEEAALCYARTPEARAAAVAAVAAAEAEVVMGVAVVGEPEGVRAARKRPVQSEHVMWTAAENELLRSLVMTTTDGKGRARWTSITKHLPGRSARQARCRWARIGTPFPKDENGGEFSSLPAAPQLPGAS